MVQHRVDVAALALCVGLVALAPLALTADDWTAGAGLTRFDAFWTCLVGRRDTGAGDRATDQRTHADGQRGGRRRWRALADWCRC